MNSRHKAGIMQENQNSKDPMQVPDFADDWRDQIKADLAAQLEAGGTLYGVRSDGAYTAQTKGGTRVIGYLDLKKSD